MEEDEVQIEVDEHGEVFNDDNARGRLSRQMSKRSPRRVSAMTDTFETTQIQFMQEIDPETALNHLFKWFCSTAPVGAQSDGAPAMPAAAGAAAVETVGLNDFNRLRQCLGQQLVSDDNWNAALEVLTDGRIESRVTRQGFEALFGPPPFFGSTDVEKIVRRVMESEEYLHFAQILVTRFGIEPDDAADGSTAASTTEVGTGLRKRIGIEQLQNIQRACCADVVFGTAEWAEACKKLNLPDKTKYLDWMQLAALFSVTVRRKTVFSPHLDPPGAVYACLANEQVLATIKDPDEESVSRKAFTNLLRVDKQKVDDDVWLELLQNMQTTYNYRSQKLARRNSSIEVDGSDALHGHEQPLVIVRNTENQVLSYEIVFTDLGSIGLTVQSDFYGHCLTVAATEGPAALHSIIENHDVVAAVNGISLIEDTPATSKEEEQARVARGQSLLDENTVRKVTFQRQESYFRYDPSAKSLSLYLKTIAQIPPDGIIVVKLPRGQQWKPENDDEGNLTLQFEIPELSDFENAAISWESGSESIKVSLDGESMIAEHSTLVFNVFGVDCGDAVVFGPCELSEGELQITDDQTDPACFVDLFTNWRYRESSLQANPLRERAQEPSDYFDESLEPLGKQFRAADPGLTLGTDFFGQCLVVTAVKDHSPASKLDVRPQDILTAIVSVDGTNDTSLNQLNCIKPFALSKNEADKHLKDVRKQIVACHKSDRPFHLQFLRLKSYYFHEDDRTIFTFTALTNLQKGTSLTVKMPSAKWFVRDRLTAKVLDPVGLKIRETFWDSQFHAVRMVLDQCSIAESTSVSIELVGIAYTVKKGGKTTSAKLAGPSEVVSVKPGTEHRPPTFEFELHEHWHSFLVGHQGIEVSKIAATLKRFKTSPAQLWEVLEYTNHLYEMSKSPNSETLSLADLNRLIGIVCGSGKRMNTTEWNTLCRTLGAKPFSGLSRRQFACCWNDIVGLSNQTAKDVYMSLHTAHKLFDEIVDIFQDGDDSDWITIDTIERLPKIAGLSEVVMKTEIDRLKGESLDGWDREYFSQIVCGGNPEIKFVEDASELWIELYYAKKLFAGYSDSSKGMKKKNLSDLLSAAKITNPRLTNELWSNICDSVGLDDTAGLRLADFIEIYASPWLGSRHAVADYYRIETFRLLPERRAKETEVSKEAVMSVAPEKVNVKDVAAKALEETASAEELFKALLEQNIEFSKLDKIEEIKDEAFKLESKFVAKHRSRERGYLHIQIRSVTELADRLIQNNASFAKDDEGGEELYVMFEITKEKYKMPKPSKKNLFSVVWAQLFGDNESKDKEYKVPATEHWHERTQELMRDLCNLEEQLGAAGSLPNGELDEVQKRLLDDIHNKIRQGEESLRPNGKIGGVPFDGRVFSSLVLRDPSPDALVRFPNDEFRLFVDFTDEARAPKYVACKIFKRVGSEKGRHLLNLASAKAALKNAEATYAILHDLVAQQERHLRLTVAEKHAQGVKSVNDNLIWTLVSKLKQKRQDLLEFAMEVDKQKEAVSDIQAELDKIAITEQASATSGSDPPIAGDNLGAKVGANAPRPSVAGLFAGHGGTQHPSALQMDGQTNDIRVKFIGQAYFDLRELFRVLHDDVEETDDLATLTTEHQVDVGVLLLHFQYKCASVQEQVAPSDLPHLTIRMAGNEDGAKVEQNDSFEYPSHSNLELRWSTEGFKESGGQKENADLKDDGVEKESGGLNDSGDLKENAGLNESGGLTDGGSQKENDGQKESSGQTGNDDSNENGSSTVIDGSTTVDGSTESGGVKKKSHEEETNGLKENDRLCIVREGDPYKLSMPYFMMIWSKQRNAGNIYGELDNGTEEGQEEMCSECQLYNWWIPDMLLKFYGLIGEPIVRTSQNKRSGSVQFPSALDLSLPPGVYKIYLLRNDTNKETNQKFRVTLGASDALAVLPGVNSVHTSFGTTPLIDVKPMGVSMNVFPAADSGEMEDPVVNQDGYYDEKYERRFDIDQELEVTTRDLLIKQAAYGKAKIKDKLKAKEIDELQRVLDALNEQKRQLEGEKMGLEGVQAVKERSLTSSDPIVFSCRFRGGHPTQQDRIVVLPADIVRVSDVLRSTILGKLQANNPQEVQQIKAVLERELSEVAEVFNVKVSVLGLLRLVARLLKRRFKIDISVGSRGDSEEGDDDTFVWDECWKAYASAPPLARRYFPLIILDLLQEVAARKDVLGISKCKLDANTLSKGSALLSIGKEIPVRMRKGSSSAQSTDCEANVKDIVEETKSVLGRSFSNGGFFVAKYVRRASAAGLKDKANETAGELCRYGPFYVEPSPFVWSPWQVSYTVTKFLLKAATSEQAKLTWKIVGNFVLSGFKYFLAVVSLSFNLSVLSGNFPKVDLGHLMKDFHEKLRLLGPFSQVFRGINDWFGNMLFEVTKKLDLIHFVSECYSGFILYGVLGLLIMATFIVYVVVQEDLLLKVQKLDAYIPWNPGKSVLSMLEHIGALLVIPLYLAIKSCVLFIAKNWRMFYMDFHHGLPKAFDHYMLFTHPTPKCPNVSLARVNHGFGIGALVLIAIYLFICLPLLLLDLYSWVPLSELEDPKKLKELAHSTNRNDIKAAIHSNADLVEWGRGSRPSKVVKSERFLRHYNDYYNLSFSERRRKYGLLGMVGVFVHVQIGSFKQRWEFQRHYDDYTTLEFRPLQKKYGYLGLAGMFTHIYLVLMAKSISRAVGALIGWRIRGGYMYRNEVMRSRSRWRIVDAFCLRFNFYWKIQYIKDKMVMPFVNIVLVTLGLWGEDQWREFNVEERANDCYKMEPSSEIKQLQMMTLHGKIISLFWLCVPDTLVLAYLAEVLNRGPLFSYFLNKKFLQADIPESERERDPVWRFHSSMRLKGEEEVIYLNDTKFYSTVTKWGSAMVEIVALFSVYNTKFHKGFYLGMALIASIVAPILELNQQVIKAYVDYKETFEKMADSMGVKSKIKKLTNAADDFQDMQDHAPGITVNTNALIRRRAAKKKKAAAKAMKGDGPVDTTRVGGNSRADGVLAAIVDQTGPSMRLGAGENESRVVNKMVSDAKDAASDFLDSDGNAAAMMAAFQSVVPKKQLVLLNALPQVSYVVLTDALDIGEGEITVSWQINARQRFHALDAIGMFLARAPGDTKLRTMDQCICYRLLKEKGAQPFGWKARKDDDKESERKMIVSRAESLRNYTKRDSTMKIRRATTVTIKGTGDTYEQHRETMQMQMEENMQKAGATLDEMLRSPKLKPYKKKMHDMLAEEVTALQKNVRRDSIARMF